jgi:putative membrane protein
MAKPEEPKTEHLLILCVDRDNDIGKKTKTATPIVGKKDNLDSALKLILADPEEADANTMFEGLRIYDNLQQDRTTNGIYEIATIAGSERGGVSADRKLVSELTDVLKRFHADGLILVTDGFSEEDIVPLVQSRIPVTSVRRVVVKHSESIEETAAVFSRYWKMIMEDPRYSRIVLGLPGALLIVAGVLGFLATFIRFDIYAWTAIVGLVILGSYLLGKGYGLDRKISAVFSRPYHYTVSGLVTNFSLIAGFLLAGVGFYQAWSFISTTYNITLQFPIDIGSFLGLLPEIIGWLIQKSLTMVVVGVCVSLAGRSVGYLLDRDSRFWRTSALVIIAAWSWTILNELSLVILNPAMSPEALVAATVIGIIVIVASGLSTYFLSRRFQDLLRDRVEEEKQPSEKLEKTGVERSASEH